MKMQLSALCLVLIGVFACQLSGAEPMVAPSPDGQIQTQVAATIFAGQTAMATPKPATREPVPTPTVVPPTPVPTSSLVISRVNIPAGACWMNSEIHVLTGQSISISATGTVNTWGGRAGSSGGPEGQEGLCGAIQCPLQGVGYGALIGRLEDLKPFFVGTKYEFTATQDGDLYFTVNDWECEDNNGLFNLKITVDQAPADR